MVRSDDYHNTILVTGATGALGPSVVNALVQFGWRVRVLALDPPENKMFSDTTEFLLGDINDEMTVRAAISDVSAVIHLAALLHINTASLQQTSQYKLINVDGTALITRIAAESGIQRLIFFSTIAVYGHGDGKLLDENTQPNPDTPYAVTKLNAERIILEAKRPDGRPLGTVLRLASVYGSRVKGNYRRLLQALAKRRFMPIGPGKNRRTLIYDKDVARATLAVLTSPNSAGKIFNVTDGEVHSLNEIIQAICDALGRRVPRVHLPSPPLRVGAKILDKGAGLLGLSSTSFSSLLEKYTEDVAVKGVRIQNVTGFRPQYNIFSGWKETIEEMRARGDL